MPVSTIIVQEKIPYLSPGQELDSEPYRSVEKRLSTVENELQTLLNDKAYTEAIFLRSQVYASLLSSKFIGSNFQLEVKS